MAVTVHGPSGSWTSRAGGHPLAPVFALSSALGVLIALFLVQPALAHQAYYGPRSESAYSHWYVLAAAFLPYGLALRAHRRGWRPSRRLLFGAAIALYLALVPAPAHQSQDVYQTLLYGRMALGGHDPYVVPPDALRDPWLAWTQWDHTPSVYGPVWTLLAALIVKASAERLTAAFLLMKTVTVALALVATWALAASTRERRRDTGLRDDEAFVILAFTFNPLVLFSVGVGAHADAAVAATFAGAILAERKGRDVPTTLLLTLAALVKAYAALVLIAWLICLVRRRGVRAMATHALAAAALAVVAYLPFWEGIRTLTGLAEIGRAASASLTGTVIRIWSGHPMDAFAAGSTRVGTVVRVASTLLLAVAVFTVARSKRTRDEPWRAGALLLSAYVLLTPWYLYWHLLGLLTLAVAVSEGAITWSTLTFSGTSLFVGSGAAAVGLVAQALARYAPPLAVAATQRRRSRSFVPTATSNGAAVHPVGRP